MLTFVHIQNNPITMLPGKKNAMPKQKRRNRVSILFLSILALLLSAMLFLTVLVAIITLPGRLDTIESAIVLDTQTVKPENDGKLVLVCGTYTLHAPAHDDMFDVTFESPLAVRYLEAFNKASRRTSRYDWESTGEPSYITGEASLGEYTLASDLLAMTPTALEVIDFGTNRAPNSFTETEDGTAYISFDDIRGVTATIDWDKIRQYSDYVRYSYEIADPNAIYTVIAVQQGSSLLLHERMDDDSILEGAVGKDAFIKAVRNECLLIIAVCGGLTVLFTFLGIKGVRYFKKSKAPAGGSND